MSALHRGAPSASLREALPHIEVTTVSEKRKGIIAFFILFAALCGLDYVVAHHDHRFDPRADENSEGQCP